MTSTAGRSGSVQTSRRSSPAPSRRSGRSSRTQTARTTRPLRKRAATRQLRYRATSSLPYRIRALRWAGSASTRSGVIRGPYLRGRPRRRRRGGRGTAYSARSRRARPITVWPSASAASISRARMNQASSRSRTRPSRRPSRRTRKRAPTSLPRWVPRRTRRSISGTAPTRQPRSATAARHSQPWPRRNRDRFGLAAWSWCTSEPGARLEIRSTTVSSMTTCQTGGANNSSSTPSSARQTASHVQRPRWRNQESVVQERDSPAARIASVTWPPRVVAAPSSSSVKVVRARRGTASARRPTSVVRMGGTAVVGMARAGEGGRAVARPDTVLNRSHPPRLAPRRRPRHAHAAERVPVNFRVYVFARSYQPAPHARASRQPRHLPFGKPASDHEAGRLLGRRRLPPRPPSARPAQHAQGLVGGAQRVIVGLGRRALQVVVPPPVGREHAVPAAALHVDEVPPGVGPEPVVVLPEPLLARADGERRRGGERLAVDPVVLVEVMERAVRPEAVVQPTVLEVGAPGQRRLVEMPGTRQEPVCRPVPLQDEQQLGPLGEVAGKVAVRPEQVLGVVLVVVPVDRPVGVIVLPDELACTARELGADPPGQELGPVEVVGRASGLEGGQHGLAHVHVRVLPSVGPEQGPVRAGLVGVEPGLRLEEPPLEQVPGLGDPGRDARHAGLRGRREREQDEGVPVAVLGRVARLAAVKDPVVAAVLAVGVRLGQEADAVRARLAVLLPAEQVGRDRVIDNEAGGRDEVARLAVRDPAVVTELVEKAAALAVDAGGVVELRDLPDVPQKELGAAKVGQGTRALHRSLTPAR